MPRSTRFLNRLRGRSMTAVLSGVFLVSSFGVPVLAGPYVTETSGVRWNDVGGVRWNDVGGLRWNDVGGVRWNDVGGLLFSDATGVRWNDVGGVRWNDVGALLFGDALPTGVADIDLDLLSRLSFLPDTSSLNVIVTYRAAPTAFDLATLQAMGIPGGTIFRRLPMVVVNATRDQIARIAALPAVRSVFADRTLSFFDVESRALIGLDEVADDPGLPRPGGATLSGAGVTIAVLDTGVDATHPDLPLGSKVVGNVSLEPSAAGSASPTPPRWMGCRTPTSSWATAPSSPRWRPGPDRRAPGSSGGRRPAPRSWRCRRGICSS